MQKNKQYEVPVIWDFEVHDLPVQELEALRRSAGILKEAIVSMSL